MKERLCETELKRVVFMGDSRRVLVSDRLERLPMTRYHKFLFVMIAVTWLFESIDLTMFTFIFGWPIVK